MIQFVFIKYDRLSLKSSIKKRIIFYGSAVLLYFAVVNAPLSIRDKSMEEDIGFFDSYQLESFKLPIFYSDSYNITYLGLEKLHPFDSKKYKRVYDQLVNEGVIKKGQTVAPPLPSENYLLTVHTKEYLKKLESATTLFSVLELMPVIALPWRLTHRKVLVPMQFASAGTSMAAKAALERGWAFNLGGGYHHAGSTFGGGFCVYSDITLAVKMLFRSSNIKKVMIIDLDAHQGNGYARDFGESRESENREKVFILDIYNGEIYPGDETAKSYIDLKIEIGLGVSDSEYLALLENALDEAFEKFKPELIIYNAGTDIMNGDPLGGLSISDDGIVKRDELVWMSAVGRKIPIMMLLSGGYQKSNAPVIAKSIKNIIQNIIRL